MTKRIIIFIILGFPIIGLTKPPEYRIDYDYQGQGDDWYGQSRTINQTFDYSDITNISTQQGDDFCLGYEPALITFNQGPELSRTQGPKSAYEFYYQGGTLCIEFNGSTDPPDNDLIFLSGFEN